MLYLKIEKDLYPMLCDTRCHEWPWERLGPALAQLASHVAYYWASQQTSLRQAESQLEQAHSQVIHKHELIARAHTMADNLQQLTLGVPFEPAAPAAAPAAAAPTGE